MASFLRQIVAGSMVRHPTARLDLCYVTEYIIVTSGPSQTWPQLAYRNPLDKLKAFLEGEHGDDWAIWEFRAEGTGYPDEAVHGRVRHYPWPDHQPPPFRLVPMIMASMRNWLHGGDLDVQASSADASPRTSTKPAPPGREKHSKRVAVIHCKAGKGRSGTISCSYLISEEGWTAKDALERFTARRIRRGFGPGVSIPSQLRWVSYVDRWTRHGKRYVDRPIEIVEVRVWGLRSGVRVDVNGFAGEGKEVCNFHTFSTEERVIVEAGEPPRSGLVDVFRDLAGYPAGAGAVDKVPEHVELADEANAAGVERGNAGEARPSKMERERTGDKLVRKGTGLVQKVQSGIGDGIDKAKSKTASSSSSSSSSNTLASEGVAGASSSEEEKPGGLAVVFRPAQPIRIPNSDVNIAVEQRNQTHKSLNWTVVSAVAHVWFNAFFEGRGPEQQGRADDSGVFSISWEAMDGIKGSSRKGSRALDKMSVVWRVAGDAGTEGEEIVQPGEGEPVPQVAAADWRGTLGVEGERDLGLRAQTQASANVSRASSLKSVERSNDGDDGKDGEALEGLKSSGPGGEDLAPSEEDEKR